MGKQTRKRASSGEARPYQRSADGRWVVAVRDGDGRRRCLYGTTRGEVLAKRDDWLVGRATVTPAASILIADRAKKS